MGLLKKRRGLMATVIDLLELTFLTYIANITKYTDEGGIYYEANNIGGFGTMVSDQFFDGDFNLTFEVKVSEFVAGRNQLLGVDPSTTFTPQTVWPIYLFQTSGTSYNVYQLGVLKGDFGCQDKDVIIMNRVGVNIQINILRNNKIIPAFTLPDAVPNTGMRFQFRAFGDATGLCRLRNPSYF
jgi:hypothetical protein